MECVERMKSQQESQSQEPTEPATESQAQEAQESESATGSYEYLESVSELLCPSVTPSASELCSSVDTAKTIATSSRGSRSLGSSWEVHDAPDGGQTVPSISPAP